MLPWTGERFIPGMQGVIEAEHLHRYLIAAELVRGLDVLDVASGEGYGSFLLSHVAKTVVGVDIADIAVNNARQKYVQDNLKFVCASCIDMPLDDASVDLVVSFETIEHHDQHEAMLAEIKRVLRPGGILLISSPNRPEYDKTLSEPNIYHVKELDLNEFSSLLKCYFQHQAIYAQRVLAGSTVVPLSNKEEGYSHFMLEMEKPINTLTHPIYFVAVASDGDLPVLGTSIYEADKLATNSDSPKFLELKIYFSELIEGQVTGYSESRTVYGLYLADTVVQRVQLYFPESIASINSIRLDIANAPAAVRVVSFKILDSDGNLIWHSNQFEHEVQGYGQIVFRDDTGVWVLCLNDDPQCELKLSAEVLRLIRPNSVIEAEVVVGDLSEKLPAYLQQFQSLHSQLLDRHPTALNFSQQNMLELMAFFAQIESEIKQKNAVIKAQDTVIQKLITEQRLLSNTLYAEKK